MKNNIKTQHNLNSFSSKLNTNQIIPQKSMQAIKGGHGDPPPFEEEK